MEPLPFESETLEKIIERFPEAINAAAKETFVKVTFDRRCVFDWVDVQGMNRMIVTKGISDSAETFLQVSFSGALPCTMCLEEAQKAAMCHLNAFGLTALRLFEVVPGSFSISFFFNRWALKAKPEVANN